MLVNATDSRLIIGRFTILPGVKVPAFPLTDAEKAAVDAFVKQGKLREVPGHGQPKASPAPVQPEPKPEPQPEPAAPEASAEDGKSGRKRSGKTGD